MAVWALRHALGSPGSAEMPGKRGNCGELPAERPTECLVGLVDGLQPVESMGMIR